MSYTVPPAAADPRSRPGTVTLSSYLLYLAAAIQVVSAVVALSTMGAQRRGMERAYADYPDLKDTAATSAVVLVVGVALVGLLFAVGFFVLGMLTGRGKNVARIVTWVVGGIALCCFASLLGLNAISPSGFAAGGDAANAPDPAEVQRIINEELPSWYGGVTLTLGIIGLLAILGAVILLALPASNAYFRRPEPTFEPPGYPTDPTAYPPAS